MIDARELRIGNWITSKSSLINSQVMVSDFEYINDKPSHYEPIPLTEEWLIKFGFHKAGCYWKHKNCNVIQVWEWKGSYNFTAKGNKRIVGNAVHILQNLYFSLTGQELQLTNSNTTL